MVTVGDLVMHVSGSHRGRLDEIDGKTGYVVQSNGVEVDFPLRDLRPDPKPAQDLLNRIPRVVHQAMRILYDKMPQDTLPIVTYSDLWPISELKMVLLLSNMTQDELVALLPNPDALIARVDQGIRSNFVMREDE